MILWAVHLAILAAALATAILLARRTPYRPVAVVLGIGLAIDLALGRKGAGGLGDYLADRLPYQGIDLALYHGSNALMSAWPASVAALAWWALDAKRVLDPAWRAVKVAALTWIAWALANVAMVTLVPLDREATQRALFACEAAAVIAGFAAWRFRPLDWTPMQRAALWLLGVELVVALLGPFRLDIYRDWYLARAAYLPGFGVLAIAQALAWRRLRE